MNGIEGGRCQRKRLVRAGCIVALLLGSIVLIDGFLESDAPEAQAAEALSVRFPESGGGGSEGDPFAVLESLEQQMGATEATPESGPLLRAIAVLPEARDLRVDAAGCTAAYVVDGDREGVLEAVEEAMGGRGWSPVPLGDGSGAAFLGGDGAYENLIATCTQVGDGVSVVFRAVES